MKRVLMVAYHFPPLSGSSGIQRTLRFVQHLPDFGWEPIVLSAHPRAYEQTSDDLQADVPQGVVIRRSFALDTARHLSIGGRYIRGMARPDRWVSWKFGAVRDGLKLIREFDPKVIWSTYPIATAHIIGAELHRRTGLPWIADFRDPMAQEGYPTDPITWKSFKAIEECAVRNAKYSMFTTAGAAQLYRERYPEFAKRILVLENGYDEESFSAAESQGNASEALVPGTITLLHSGLIYPEERDPTQLFVALRQMKESGKLKAGDLKIRFRAAVHDDLLTKLASEQGVIEFIDICKAIPYRMALLEMLRADALLVMQASNCNEQIPAKIYEYLRAKRPIVALTDPKGDTAGVLRAANLGWISPLDSAQEIGLLLLDVVDSLRHNTAPIPSAEAVAAASRRSRTESLAQTLDRCSDT